MKLEVEKLRQSKVKERSGVGSMYAERHQRGLRLNIAPASKTRSEFGGILIQG